MVIVSVAVEKDDMAPVLLRGQQGQAGGLRGEVALGELPAAPRRSTQVQEELCAGWERAAADRARVCGEAAGWYYIILFRQNQYRVLSCTEKYDTQQ